MIIGTRPVEGGEQKAKAWSRFKAFHYDTETFLKSCECYLVCVEGYKLVDGYDLDWIGFIAANKYQDRHGKGSGVWYAHKTAVCLPKDHPDYLRLWAIVADHQAQMQVARGRSFVCKAPADHAAYRDLPNSGWEPASKDKRYQKEGYRSHKYIGKNPPDSDPPTARYHPSQDVLGLERCSRTDSRYVKIRDEHYVDNSGACGRQLHYIVWYHGQIAGIISGGSCMGGCKARADFFGLHLCRAWDKYYRSEEAVEWEGGDPNLPPSKHMILPLIINNTVFRMVNHEYGLASRVLALWRYQVIEDWNKKYEPTDLQCFDNYWDERIAVTSVIGFETTVKPTLNRKGETMRSGTVYEADGWTFAGMTKGIAKKRAGGGILHGKVIYTPTTPKRVYCRVNEDFERAFNAEAEETLINVTMSELSGAIYEHALKRSRQNVGAAAKAMEAGA
jgi:hypothetical protein